MTAIAAVIYGPDEDCDVLLSDFARDLSRAGVAVAGLVQVNAGASCAEIDMELELVGSGRRFNICQDLGSGSVNACRLDPAGLAAAAGALREALERPASLVIVNKFGRAEAEGGGLLAEIGAAVAAGLPLIVGVPKRFTEAWAAFSGGMDDRLACARPALDAWWSGQVARAA